MQRRIDVGAALAVLVFAFTSCAADAGHATAAPEPFFFRLSPIRAVSTQAQSSTTYTVSVTNAPAGNAPYARWYLQPKPSASGAVCTNAILSGGTPSGHGELVWKNQGPTFVWYHGAKGTYSADRSYGCDQATIGRAGYPGKVTVVYENDSQHCTAYFAGVPTSSTPTYGPAAVCALGGYLPLPVPHRLLEIYTTVDNKLNALIERGPTSHLGDKTIDSILAPQTNAFAHLFPPVWGCRFDTIFDHVLKAKSSFGTDVTDVQKGETLPNSALAQDVGYLDAMAGSLRACTPSAARPIGVPEAVIRSVVELGNQTATLERQPDRAKLATELSSLESRLDGIVRKSFPSVFGMSYTDLVDRVLAENAAIALAERDASAGHDEAAASALVQVAGHEQKIGHALHAQAKRAGKAEAAA
jgi:hypothetical protein